LDLVTGFQGSNSTRSERSPLDSRLSKDSNEEKRAAIPTSPVLTPTGKIFPRLTNENSSYETAGETSNSFYSQTCSSEEAGRISVEMQDIRQAMSLKNTTTAKAGFYALGADTDPTSPLFATEAATGGYIINMEQASTSWQTWAEPQPQTHDASTLDLSLILANNDDEDNTSELNTPTMDLGEEEILGEFQVASETERERPIVLHEGVLTELWNLTPPASKMTKAPSFPAAGKMMCVNPLDVEGRGKGSGKRRMAGQQQQTAFEVTARAAPTVKRGPRPKLKLAMPPRVKTEEQSGGAGPAGLTPIIEQTLADGGGSFDLLAYVTDSTIKVDDPAAIAHMGLSAPSPPPATIKLEPVAGPSSSEPPLGKRRRTMTERARAAVKVEKEEDEEWRPRPKRRGRPPVKKTVPKAVAAAATAASSDHSYGEGGRASKAAASEDDIKEAKYRRMRDLNNEASKRCRQNRKRKQASLEEEAEALQRKNAELQLRVGQMEELLERLKSKFVEKVANPSGLK